MLYGGSSADRYGGSSADRDGVAGRRDRRVFTPPSRRQSAGDRPRPQEERPYDDEEDEDMERDE